MPTSIGWWTPSTAHSSGFATRAPWPEDLSRKSRKEILVRRAVGRYTCAAQRVASRVGVTGAETPVRRGWWMGGWSPWRHIWAPVRFAVFVEVRSYRTRTSSLSPDRNFSTPRVRTRFSANVRPTMRGERSEEHTSELQSRREIVCRLLLEKKKQHGRG